MREFISKLNPCRKSEQQWADEAMARNRNEPIPLSPCEKIRAWFIKHWQFLLTISVMSIGVAATITNYFFKP